MRKGNFELLFDKEVKTRNGYVCAVKVYFDHDEESVATAIDSVTNEHVKTEIAGRAEVHEDQDDSDVETEPELAAPALTSGKCDVNCFHELLGHPSEAKTRKVAKYYGVKLFGKFETCGACAKAKAKQADVPKKLEKGKRSVIPGEKLMFDVSSIKTRSIGGSKYWLLVMDDATGFIWSFFLKTKSEVSKRIVELVKHLKKNMGYEVKTMRCDNAGENLMTETACSEEGLGINFEYTAVNTPQQNGRVERKFATLYGRVRAMLNSARLSKKLRGVLWAECAKTATFQDNLDCDNGKGKTRHSQFWKQDAKGFNYMRVFGEVGIATQGEKMRGKLENRGLACLYLGHAWGHADDVHRLLKLSTRRVIRSRDVRWLDKKFDQYMKEENTDEEEYSSDEEHEDSDNEDTKMEEESKSPQVEEDDDTSSDDEAKRITRSSDKRVTFSPDVNNKRVRNALKKLSGTSFNPIVDKVFQKEVNNKTTAIEYQELVDEFAKHHDDENPTHDDHEDEETKSDAGREVMNHTIENLFEDLSFVAWDDFMEEIPSVEAALTISENLRDRLKHMHILDRLDWINDEGNRDKTNMDLRNSLLRECVQELKDDLPSTYEEAWDHPDEKFRKRWRTAINKELDSLINIRKVWNKIKKKEMPKGRRCVKSKWVFDIKRSGLFKVRLVACGYSQIPGVDLLSHMHL